MLELRDLSRRYGQTVALDGLSLAVPEGEVVGFVGPNGAGKTTAMRIALFGYVLWSAIYAIAGAIVSRQEDLQASSTPATLALVVCYLVALPALDKPDSPLAVIASLVPFSSPIVMPARAAVGEASTAEIAASLGLLALAIALLVPLGARIYEGAVVRMGKPLRMREAWRVARASS